MRFDVIRHHRWWFTVSSILVIISIISMFVRGFNLGIDYTGGTIVELQFKQNVQVSQVRDDLKQFNLENSVIQLSGSSSTTEGNDVIIRTRNLDASESKAMIDSLTKNVGPNDVKRVESIGAVIGFNLLFELLGVTNKSEAYTEVAAQQYSAHFIVGILVFGFISPIAEELLFRGVIYGYLRRFMDIKLAIALSALIYGVYHMNYVQGVYGFLIGCLMAYAYEYFGEFKMAVFVHVASNVLAYCLSYTAIAVTGFVSWPVCVIFLAVAVVSLITLHKQKNIF